MIWSVQKGQGEVDAETLQERLGFIDELGFLLCLLHRKESLSMLSVSHYKCNGIVTLIVACLIRCFGMWCVCVCIIFLCLSIVFIGSKNALRYVVARCYFGL